MRPSATNAVGIDPAYVQPKDRPVSSHPTVHPYQPTVGTQSRPGGDTGLSTGIIHISGPGTNPAATQSSADTGTAGPQTRLQGNQDRADEEEREADVRAEEIYAAMEGEEHQPQHWVPPTINLPKRVQAYWMFGQDGEISEIPWNQDAEYRRFQAQPPIDDMLRPLIIPQGGITVQVMEEDTRRSPFYPHGVERQPTPEGSPPWRSNRQEEKEEGDLIETKDDEDEDNQTPDQDYRGTPPPPGSTYLYQNITDTGEPRPFSAGLMDAWMGPPPLTTTTHGLVTAATETTTALPSQTIPGATTAVSPTEGAPGTMPPGWGQAARSTGHDTRAAARAQSNTTAISVVTQTHGGDGETAGSDHGSGAGPTTIPGASDPGAHGTGESTIAFTSTSVPTHQATTSSSDILSRYPLINTEAPPGATRGTQHPFPGYGQNAEAADWNTKGEPIFQENTPQAPEPSLPPRPSRRPAGKTKGTKKKSNKKGR